ncbi:uncharacterized protein LOC141857450 [Brevipalpus obovatus]|uniref:uncharacterized protein LOC141857450 n=1 Tax=Brevipalpus obovatus TaxID=246614 RepID=UPI003D9F8200
MRDYCKHCGRYFRSKTAAGVHQCPVFMRFDLPFKFGDFEMISHAFNKYLSVYRQAVEHTTLSALYIDQATKIQGLLRELIKHQSPLKVQLCTRMEMIKPLLDTVKHEKINMCTRSMSLICYTDVDGIVETYFKNLEASIDQFTQRGSGWILKKFDQVEVRIGRYEQDQGGCIEYQLPPDVITKKAVLRLDCHDDCFMWSVLASLHPTKKNANRCYRYVQFFPDYDFSGVRGVVKIKSIDSFESRNNISVNVYTMKCERNDGKRSPMLVPLRVVRKKREKHVNLFLYEEHYYPIRDFNRLCATRNSWRRYWCDNCLSGFRDEIKLANHREYCYDHEPQRIDLPWFSKIKFKDHYKSLKHPFIIYADFETLVQKDSDQQIVYVPCSVGLIVVDWTGSMIDSFFYRGPEAAREFVSYLARKREPLREELIRRKKSLEFTAEIRQRMGDATNCHICGEEFQSDSDKVADHCHLTGEFRGAAHVSCNCQLQLKQTIPVVLHNFKNFDSHIIVQGLDHEMVHSVKVIPQSTEKFIAMKIDDYQIIDSYAFLASSLDDLAKNTRHDLKEKYLKYFFEDISLLMQKGTFPYEFIDDFNRFEVTVFPSEDKFYSKLKKQAVDTEKYENTKNIWLYHGCRNIGDLHDIYLKMDVCLLAAVFEQFREMSLEEFGLDPSHFFSSPGLTWAAAMKYTKAEIELLKDIDMILMVEKGIRGGVSSAVTHHATANQEYLPGFSPYVESSFIIYLDVNNLYGHALKQPMPFSEFEWVEEKNFDKVFEEILGKAHTSLGYILEVDLMIPHELHDLYDEYPLAPEKITISKEELSKHQKDLLGRMAQRGFRWVPSEKLIPNLYPKKKYVVHYRTLKFYIEHGMKVEKCHRILSFREKAWIEPYVDLCTSRRQQATTNFQKDFWKLLVNSLFGKSIENKRKYCNVKVILNHNELSKNLKNPLFDEFMILDRNKAFLKCRKRRVIMDKPIFLGFTVLELSKLHMYYLHYDVFKASYKERLKLIYTDTDSFIYHIKTRDIFRDFSYFADIMDFSDYPKDHPLHSEVNKKVIGKLKDEMAGELITEVIALKSKMYFVDSRKKELKRAKGVINAVLRTDVTKQMYVDCLFLYETFKQRMRRIGSKNHTIVGVNEEKLSLTPFDDKRYALNNIDTLAYGNYRIEGLQNGDGKA